MVFSSFTRTVSGTQIFFKNSAPIEYVEALKYYKDDSSGTFTKKEFRWSFDNNYWASWETLNQGNISNIAVRGNQHLFLDIRYTPSNPSAKVTGFEVSYTQVPANQRVPCPPGGGGTTPVTPTPLPPQYGGSGPCVPSVTEIVNAQTLCGQSCEYYLWRPNHKGQQSISTITNLQSTLNNLAGGIQNSITAGDNETGTGFGVYSRKDGQTLYFKRIDASGTLSISEANGVITLSSDASGGGGSTTLEELTDVSVSGKTINQVLTWKGTYWEPETGSVPDVTKAYVDGSLNARDASITFLFDWNYVLDASISEINGHLIKIDSSINELYELIADISTGVYGIENIGGEASIYSETVSGVARLRSIQGTNGINVYVDGSTIIIDGSISGGNISGVVNIGGGDGSIFSAIDSSGNIELRTIDGSGGTTVITSGNKIIISTDLVSDSSVKNITNIGTGEGLVLANIDGSGTAELRRISGTGAISVSTDGNNIVLYSDASITVDPCTWSDSDPISADVGGLVAGDIINTGTNSIQILEDILYEYFPPNVTMQIDPSPGPTSSTGYYEKWVDTPIANGASLTYSFNNNDFTKVRVWDVSVFENGAYYRTDNWGGLASIPPYTTFDVSPDIGTASTDLTYDFKFGNKLTDGTIMPNYDTSVGLRWVDPYFYGTVAETVNASNITNADILGLGNKIIMPEQTNEVSYDVSANFQKIKFVYAYPASYSDLRSIFDVKNDFNVTSSFDASVVNVKMSGLSGPGPYVFYKVYIKSHWISFTPDVSIFKLIFNI